jgi:hypothetical protein
MQYITAGNGVLALNIVELLQMCVALYLVRPPLTDSKLPPFVSGIMNRTQSNCPTIIAANVAKIHPDPIYVNAFGIREGMSAAKIQCTDEPKACPEARRWFGKTSAMNTQITVPCPTAWEAMNRKKKTGTTRPFQPSAKARATSPKERT